MSFQDHSEDQRKAEENNGGRLPTGRYKAIVVPTVERVQLDMLLKIQEIINVNK